MSDKPQAFVLAAGLGTRLWPLTRVRAKAATPVAGRPLIARVLDRLAAGGCTDVIVNLHHLPACAASRTSSWRRSCGRFPGSTRSTASGGS